MLAGLTLVLLIAAVWLLHRSSNDAGLLPPPSAAPGAPGGTWLIPAGRETAIIDLLGEFDGAALEVEDVEIRRGRIVAHIANSDAAEVARVTITYTTRPETSTDVLTTLDQPTQQALSAWTARIESRDGGAVWTYSAPGPAADSDQAGLAIGTTSEHVRSALRATLGVVPPIHLGVCALALLACLVVYRRGSPIAVTRNIKITHVLPATLQATLFAYWLAHWPEGRLLVPMLAIQLVYAYALDFLFSVLHGPRWQAGLGPVPVVLSTNLFAQFMGDSFWCAVLAIAIGLAAKTFIQRNGRHIFNPSVIGLTVVAAIELASPSIGSPDFAHQFDAPPNMTELILMLALIVQLRLPVALVTLGAALGILAANRVAPDAAFNPAWAAVTLVLCLLITDPATIPRSEKGKLLFGAFIGVGMIAGHNILLAAGYTDFWAKVACVPLANLLVPSFNRLADRLPEVPGLSPRFAKLHVALWLALSLTILIRGKVDTFRGSDPANFSSPCYVTETGPNRCETNPMYCRPFSFASELRCVWARTDRS